MWFYSVLLACSGDDATMPTQPSDTPAFDVAVVASTVSPTVIEVSWTPPEAGRHEVVASAAGLPDVRAEGDAPTLRLVGLVAGSEYTVTARTSGADGVAQGEGSYRVPGTPTNLPSLSVTAADDHSLAGGVIVTTIIQSDGGWVVAFDAEGRLVWWWDVGHRGQVDPDFPTWDGAALPVTSRLDGGDVLVGAYDSAQTLDVGRVWRIPADAMTADEIEVTRTEWAHHDFVYHRDEGRMAWLGYQFETIDGTRWASDRILEGPAGGASYERVWSWFDDYARDTGVEPSAISPLTGGFVQQQLATDEWTHSNSLMYDRGTDAYFVMSKFHDAVVRVERASGETLWTLGGPNSDFTLPDGSPVWASPYDTALWSHAHMSHWWVDPSGTAGGFVVFDNGYHYPAMRGGGTGWSRVSEYRYDESTMVVERVWEVLHPDGRFTPLMGDVRKLDTATPRYLVGWSSLACIEEIREDGSSAWEGCLPLGQIMGRTTWYEGLSAPGE